MKSTPGSLQQALDALEVDYAFLLRGDVFTKDVIETWLSYKRESEVDAIALRPIPTSSIFISIFRSAARMRGADIGKLTNS
ncbi:MAG: hypothetical protein WCB23_04600, partial [Pseudolabrys sp.]